MASTTQAGPALVHTFTGNVALKHIVGGATACTANGTMRIDIYSLSSLASVPNSVANVNVQGGQCYTAEEKYTTTPNGKGWKLADPVTNVPGSIAPTTLDANGTPLAYNALLIMRMPLEAQSNFAQLTSTDLIESTGP